MKLFDIIGYVGVVSEPNGPRVVGYFLDDWGQQKQKAFDKWLTEHDKEILSKVSDYADHLDAACTDESVVYAQELRELLQ